MGAISSTLHVKVKFRIEQGIRGSQQVARQCLVAMVNWKMSWPIRGTYLRRSLYSNYRSPKREEGLVMLRSWSMQRYYWTLTSISKYE